MNQHEHHCIADLAYAYVSSFFIVLTCVFPQYPRRLEFLFLEGTLLFHQLLPALWQSVVSKELLNAGCFGGIEVT